MVKVRTRPETGRLFFDGWFRGRRFKELTALKAQPVNIARAEKLARKMNAEIAAGTFLYRRYFPNSKRAALFDGVATVIPDFDAPVATYSAPALRVTAIVTPTFGVFARQFFAEQGVGWRVNTHHWMDSLLKTHLLPVFGDRSLSSIKREDLLAFRLTLSEKRNQQNRGLSPKTINTIMRVLKAILTEASYRFGVPNPATGIKRLKVQRKDIFPFTLDEAQRILQTVRADYRAFLIVAFFTGMRPGELIGLKWEYVDLDQREIRVRETYTKGRVEYTKTDGSQREIRMSPPVFDALSAHQLSTAKVSEYVFCLRNGQPIDAKNFSNRIWHPLLRHLGLKRRTPYQTRHTAATLWLASGENPEWVARQLGHTTTEMLFRVYSRFIPNLTRQDGSAFERVLAQAGVIKADCKETTHAS